MVLTPFQKSRKLHHFHHFVDFFGDTIILRFWCSFYYFSFTNHFVDIFYNLRTFLFSESIHYCYFPIYFLLNYVRLKSEKTLIECSLTERSLHCGGHLTYFYSIFIFDALLWINSFGDGWLLWHMSRQAVVNDE